MKIVVLISGLFISKRKFNFNKVQSGLQERINSSFGSSNNYEVKTIRNTTPRAQSVSKTNKSNFSTPPSIASDIDQSSWTKIPNRHSPNFIMSDGSYDSPTQKYLDSHSSSPSRSPKSIGNSQSNSPIANDDDGNLVSNNIYKNLNSTNIYRTNENNNVLSPALNSRFSSANNTNIYRSTNSSNIQNSSYIRQKEREIPSFSPTRNNNYSASNLSHLPEIEDEDSESTENNAYNRNSTLNKNTKYNFDSESGSDVFDMKLNESETKLTKKFSRNISNLVTPQSQKNTELELLSDSDSSSSTNFNQKKSTKSFSFNNSNKSQNTYTSFSVQKSTAKIENDFNEKNSVIYLSESETNESDLSSNELNSKVTSYINHLKYLSSSDLETSSTSSINANKTKNNLTRNVNMYLDSESDTNSENSTNINIKRKARRQINSFTPKADPNKSNDLILNSDSETTEDSSNQHISNLTRNNYNAKRTNYNTNTIDIPLGLDSEMTSEESANIKYENLARNSNNPYTTKLNYINIDSDLNLNSETETTSESLIYNYTEKTEFKSPTLRNKPFTPNQNFISDSEEPLTQEISSNVNKFNNMHTNDLNLKFNYTNNKRSNIQSLNPQSTPVVRSLAQDLPDNSSSDFIETQKFPIPKKNESAIFSESSEEFKPEPINNNYISSTTPRQYTRYSSPKNSSVPSVDKDITNYSAKRSNNSSIILQPSARTPQTSSLMSNKRSYNSSYNSKSRNSFIANASNLLSEDDDNETDSDDEFFATLKKTIRDNEVLLKSFGHSP